MPWTEVTQAIASAASAVISLIGFIAVIYQLIQLQRSVEGDTHSRLFDQGRETIGILFTKPEIRPYFYDNKPIDQDDELYGVVMTYADMIAAWFEHVALQRKTLPPEVWDAWLTYIRGRYDSSEVLRNYLSVHGAEYSVELWKALGLPKEMRVKISESDRASLISTREQNA